MEISEAQEVNEVLNAKSHTTTLDELRAQGKDHVKVIRPSDVTAMITETVHRVLRDTEMLSAEDIDLLVQHGSDEFRRVFHERQLERQRIEQKFRDVQDELFEARNRIHQLETELAGGDAGDAGGPGVQRVTGNADMADALDKIAANLDERLEKISKKVGVSSAVEAKEINYERLFDDDQDDLESNMADFEVQKKSGGGITGNLERLKKLKGDG